MCLRQNQDINKLLFVPGKDHGLFERQDVIKDEGIIFDIKRYAIHDGPGIRTTIFLKGCPLSCRWCHNPESRSSQLEKVILSNNIKEAIGRKITVSELFNTIKKDIIFYDESGGGVTFSGGEPLMQSDFLYSILKLCKEEGIHTTVDTSGYADWALIEKIVPLSDLFLYDIKLLDEKEHIKYTGVGNALIINNLLKLIDLNKKIILRMPIIPAITNTEKNLSQFKDFIKSLPVRLPVEFLNFNIFATEKYHRFHLPLTIKYTDPISDDRLNALMTEFNNI